MIPVTFYVVLNNGKNVVKKTLRVESIPIPVIVRQSPKNIVRLEGYAFGVTRSETVYATNDLGLAHIVGGSVYMHPDRADYAPDTDTEIFNELTKKRLGGMYYLNLKRPC